VATITFDAKGHVTAAGASSIAIAVTGSLDGAQRQAEL
jgi:hypothetical protein